MSTLWCSKTPTPEKSEIFAKRVQIPSKQCSACEAMFFRSVECFRVVKVFAKPGWSVLSALCVVLERHWNDLSNWHKTGSVWTALSSKLVVAIQNRIVIAVMIESFIHIPLYPNVKVVWLHFLSLPVKTRSVERAFSEIRLLKTWLRSTMSDECRSAWCASTMTWSSHTNS